MASLKQHQDREQDIIVATTSPSLLARLLLAAILRNRAIDDYRGVQIAVGHVPIAAHAPVSHGGAGRRSQAHLGDVLSQLVDGHSASQIRQAWA